MHNKLFKDLKESLEEVIAYKEGKLDLRSERIEVSMPKNVHENKQDNKTTTYQPESAR